MKKHPLSFFVILLLWVSIIPQTAEASTTVNLQRDTAEYEINDYIGVNLEWSEPIKVKQAKLYLVNSRTGVRELILENTINRKISNYGLNQIAEKTGSFYYEIDVIIGNKAQSFRSKIFTVSNTVGQPEITELVARQTTIIPSYRKSKHENQLQVSTRTSRNSSAYMQHVSIKCSRKLKLYYDGNLSGKPIVCDTKTKSLGTWPGDRFDQFFLFYDKDLSKPSTATVTVELRPISSGSSAVDSREMKVVLHKLIEGVDYWIPN